MRASGRTSASTTSRPRRPPWTTCSPTAAGASVSSATSSRCLRGGGKRVLGYRRALAARGLGGNVGLLIVESHRPATAEPIREWLAANRRVEAVICSSANICCAALQALHELAVAVPAGMALVSFDDTRWMPFLCPPVTFAIRRPADRLGTLALDLLLER